MVLSFVGSSDSAATLHHQRRRGLRHRGTRSRHRRRQRRVSQIEEVSRV